jgi:hypothetical protein
MLYVYEVYILANDEGEKKDLYSLLLIVGVVYPAWYEAY